MSQENKTHAIHDDVWIPDLDEAVYHADRLTPEPSLSSTLAKTILSAGGEAKARYMMTHPHKATSAMEFGSAAHARILGRGQEVEVIDGNRNTKAVKEAIAEAESAGKLVLKSEDNEKIDAMAEAILAHETAAELLTAGAGLPELSMFTRDAQTGRWCRGRIDFLASSEMIVDYKTTASAHPRDFERHAWFYGYHIQAAHYLRMACQLGLAAPDAAYVLIAQEKTPPFSVATYQLDDDLLVYGDELVGTAIRKWDRCLATGNWPGYAEALLPLGTPRWVEITDREAAYVAANEIEHEMKGL